MKSWCLKCPVTSWLKSLGLKFGVEKSGVEMFSIPEKSVGPYPFLVNQTNGKIVPVVQAYAYAKYLGHLVLTFDEDGKLINYDGNPILLKQDLPQGKLKVNKSQKQN